MSSGGITHTLILANEANDTGKGISIALHEAQMGSVGSREIIDEARGA